MFTLNNQINQLNLRSDIWNKKKKKKPWMLFNLVKKRTYTTAITEKNTNRRKYDSKNDFKKCFRTHFLFSINKILSWELRRKKDLVEIIMMVYTICVVSASKDTSKAYQHVGSFACVYLSFFTNPPYTAFWLNIFSLI